MVPVVRACGDPTSDCRQGGEGQLEGGAVNSPREGGPRLRKFTPAERTQKISVSADGRLLLVGHEPDFSRVAGELTGGRVDLKKGGLAALRLDGATGELLILMRPRELALIAGLPVGGD